jgi:hypothetical protein
MGAALSAAGLGAAGGTLFGAAASNAGLAALGGGSLASGGLGMAGGTTIIGATGGLAGGSIGHEIGKNIVFLRSQIPSWKLYQLQPNPPLNPTKSLAKFARSIKI